MRHFPKSNPIITRTVNSNPNPNRCSYKAGRDAARIALEEANSRDMTKLMNKGNERRRPRSQPDLAPINRRSPQTTPARTPFEPEPTTKPQPDEQDTDTTAPDTDSADEDAVEPETKTEPLPEHTEASLDEADDEEEEDEDDEELMPKDSNEEAPVSTNSKTEVDEEDGVATTSKKSGQ